MAAGLSAAVLSTKLLQKKKKKKGIIKRISLKGHFSRLVELKLDLPAVFWFVGTCLHMTGTWKYHALLWQFDVLVSRGVCYGFPQLPHGQSKRAVWEAIHTLKILPIHCAFIARHS